MLEWYVLKDDFGSREVRHYNALCNWEDDIKQARKKCKTREQFKEWLRKELMYHYWSKAECEIQVAGLFAKTDDEFKKIDIWDQIQPNLDIMVDYIIYEMKFKNLK